MKGIKNQKKENKDFAKKFKLKRIKIYMVGREYSDENYFSDVNPLLRDLEEKQKILKERLSMVSENLINLKEKTTRDNLEIKKSILKIQEQMKKLLSFLEMASSEMTKFAKKEEVEILYKQIKMFKAVEGKED